MKAYLYVETLILAILYQLRRVIVDEVSLLHTTAKFHSQNNCRFWEVEKASKIFSAKEADLENEFKQFLDNLNLDENGVATGYVNVNRNNNNDLH